MHISDQQLTETLKLNFGYDTFRSPQLEIIKSILHGKDTFALMPTGAGKSLCYQLPSLLLPGLTVVISPLIALMKDQVDHLVADGISAGCVNSAMSRSELIKVAQMVNSGKIKILFLSPERLAIPKFQQWLTRKNISLIAIDEAHCISEWGHDFRPDYRQLTTLRNIFPKVPIIALTATAIPEVKNDIISLLQLHNPQLFQTSFNRPNLHYIIRQNTDPWEELITWLKKYQNESVVIYCLTRKKTEYLASDLQAQGFSAIAYHAGLDKKIRSKVQDDFQKDKVNIVVATIAFGMGIDKPNIRLVVHYDLPKSLEGYYQETGRAGRDGLLSHCLLFLNEDSTFIHQRFIARTENEQAKKIAQKKLDQMIDFCTANSCRRKYVLNYFAEKMQGDDCQSCDACLPKYTQRNIEQSIDKPSTYHAEVFEKLRRLRKRIAELENVPPFVIFGDQSLQEMAMYLPTSKTEFGKIAGVGKYKLEKYGVAFPKLIQQLCEANNLKPQPNTKKQRLQKIKKFSPGSTYSQTLILINQGLTLKQVAKKRKLTVNTIVAHIEKISQMKKTVNIDHLSPPKEQVELMRPLFAQLGYERLSPIKELLGEKYSYDEIRLVRIFLNLEKNKN